MLLTRLFSVMETVTAFSGTSKVNVLVQPKFVSVTNTVYVPASSDGKGSSRPLVKPLGPLQAYVNGPGVPITLISKAPLNGALQLELAVIIAEAISTGALSGTLSVKTLKQPRFESVIVTV